MEEHRNLPNFDRLSAVTAMILLAYSLAAFIQLPQRTVAIQLPGFLFEFSLNFFTILSVVVAVLAFSGSAWVLAAHPHIEGEVRWQHLVIPALTAVAIGIPLNELAVSGAWWVVFALGGLLFISVLVSEYISIDSTDTRYAFAAVGLNGVSLALFLVLAIALRGADLRLYALISVIVPAIALVSARSLHLRNIEKNPFPWAVGIALIIGQLAICLFYLPFRPIQFGILLFAAAYGLTSLAGNIQEEYSGWRAFLEPVIMFSFFFVLSFVF